MVTINQEIVDEFVKGSFLSRMISESGYNSVGIRVVQKDKVVHELTSSYNKKKLIFKDGISNPDFIVSVDYKFLKSLSKKRLGWIKENPIKAYLKYHDKVDMPFFVKLRILAMLNEA